MAQKSYVDMLVNSVITAGVALFSITGSLNSQEFWLVGVKAFGLAFFIQLMVERGLKPNEFSEPA